MNQEIPGFGQQSGPDIKRLLLAGLLMSGILMTFNHFFAPPAKKPEDPKAQAQPSQVAQNQPSPSMPAPIETPLPAIETDPAIVATADNVLPVTSAFKIPVTNSIIENDPAWPKGGYSLSSENAGGKISQLVLYGYHEPVKLFEGAGSGMFSLKSRENSTRIEENAPYEVVSSGPNEISYQRTTAEGMRIVRRYHFSKDNYLFKHEIEVENISQRHQRLELDVIFRTDGKVAESSLFSGPTHELNFLVHQNESLERQTHADVLKSPLRLNGPTDFIAIEQRYFLVSVVPKEPKRVYKILAQANYLDDKKDSFASTLTMSLFPVELEPRSVVKWEFESYIGPKQIGMLKLVGSGLDETVNFGWFGVISRPLLWLLVQIFGLVNNFGIAIILLTLLIKLLTFPLTQKSFVSMQQVKKIGPEIKALEKKYGHDRTTLSQKQMELYKEKGVNPMAGCLPMFLQFPVWIALYQMLSNSIEIYQKPFAGWLMDLTQPDPYYVLPVLMGISMVIQQLLQPVQDDQKAMKYAMLGTSVLFTFIMLNLPSGLSLYMLTNNLLTVIQQIVIKKRFEERTA